ncbi:hypothetical protein HGM15179_015544 [Zosterops borbonicus]|uniref:Uncharacterized protein n=1 Tax=Zosterops borbonicus TaxID=364589 RepID=A0A8K1LFA0_9PASS|nr:hypothetical protein HGM15179_015544 [Zosterops borbonicus]
MPNRHIGRVWEDPSSAQAQHFGWEFVKSQNVWVGRDLNEHQVPTPGSSTTPTIIIIIIVVIVIIIILIIIVVIVIILIILIRDQRRFNRRVSKVDGKILQWVAHRGCGVLEDAQNGKLNNLSCLEQEDGADDLQIPSSNIIL